MSAAIEREELAWSVTATGSGSRTLEDAAQVFWSQITGHDLTKPLSQIRDRFRLLATNHDDRILRVVIDNVIDPQEGHDIARFHWKQWGVLVAITCREEVADAIETHFKPICNRVDVPDYSETELRKYLETHFGQQWLQIPADIRNTLRRPLLARLYRERGSLEPTTEYELYSGVWRRLLEDPAMLSFKTDIIGLRRCIQAAFEMTATYPWSIETLARLGLDGAAITRLVRIGWLSAASNDCYRVWHDRLLNWGLAECLAANLRDGSKSFDEVCKLVKPLLHERRGKVFWGYVLMDLLWLMLRSDWSQSTAFIDAYLRALEELRPFRRDYDIYSTDIVTLGPRVISHLLRRVQQAALDSNEWLIREIGKALGKIGGATSTTSALQQLLHHESRRVQRAAMLVIRHVPSPTHLDRLWQLHCERERDHSQFDWADERGGEYHSYKDAMAALRACVTSQPAWVTEALRRAHAVGDPIWDLGWLINSLSNGEGIWGACCERLFELTAATKPRVLAVNMGRWRDRSQLNWLIPQVASNTDRVGPSAFDALTLIDESIALQCLRSADAFELYPARGWWLPRLLIRCPDAVERELSIEVRRRVGRDKDFLLQIYQDFEDEMPPLLVEDLLSRLEEQLVDGLRNPREGNRPDYRVRFAMAGLKIGGRAMTQPGLFDAGELPDAGGSGRVGLPHSGTDTSRQAAFSMLPLMVAQLGQVLDFIVERGDFGAT